MKKKYSKKRGPVRAKKTVYDGVQFQSGLEVYMYKALKQAKIVGEYEPTSYTLLEGFDLEGICFEKQANGKGEYKDRGCKKILPIKYKPDFVGRDFIIECKGRANESFPLRWKMFKYWIALRSPNIALFKPQNQKDCDYTIKQIELMRSNLRTNATKKPSSI